MVFEIRKTTNADLPTCSKLRLQEFNRIGEHWTRTSAKARTYEFFEKHSTFCFCLVLNGKVIGTLFGEPFYGQRGKYLYLMDFVIDLRHQGKGFGLKALNFIEELAKEKGFKALVLDTNKKRKAIKIYKKFGFKKTDYVLLDKKL